MITYKIIALLETKQAHASNRFVTFVTQAIVLIGNFGDRIFT
jgi:hypothetical protein